ncbi:RNA polymerase II subunit B1 CTD phosphatase Rpap2, partial [Asbolus verrucosus]
MQILQFAIEGKMRSDALFKCLPYINQSHYQDIVEERAISKLCGYPLCSKRIPDMPKKQFYISTKNNKVYDITDRKNYCSNYCYRASIHVKNQIDTSPLWLRKHDEKAHFTLLHKSEKGLPGEVVDQGVTKPVVESLFTSISVFTEMSLDEAEEYELNPQEEKESKSQLKRPKKFQKIPMKTINENEEEEQTELDEAKRNDAKETSSDHRKDEIKIPELRENKENERKIENKTKLHSATSSKLTNEIDVESQILKCFKEWLTLETYMFVYGEEKVKEKLDSQKVGDYFESLKVAELQIEQQKRYMDICRKLHLKELAEEKFDNVVVGEKVLNPIPDFQQLKKESKEITLKVKSFYSGDLHIQEDTNFPTKNKSAEERTEEGPLVVMPLVDVNSQNALRRKIFLNSLNKTVQTLFQILRVSPNLVLSDLQALVKTFKLKSDNIVFKPAVWNYIAVVLLKIVALKDDNLHNILEEDRSKEQLSLWMSSFPHKGKLIDDMLEILQDIDTFKVIENVHQINFTRRKVLDKLIYQNILKSKKLIELKMEQALFEDRLKYGFLSQIEQEKTAQIITGKVQDAMLKNEAALTIKQIYTEIIDIMKKDALYYDSIITTIENDGFSQSKCFLGAIRLGQLAMEYLDDRRQEYNTLKKIIMEDMTTRKLDIKMLQEQLKSAATTIKHLLRKESDINTCIVKLPDTPSMDALRKEAAEIESTLDEQLKQKKRLKIMAEKCERDRDNILNKINHAELANSVLKNTMIETTGNYKKRKKELIASINQLTKKIETNQAIVQNKNNLAANVRIALWQLLQLSKQIRLEREDKKKSILINLFTVDLENAPKEPERDENNAFKIIPILISRFTCLMSSYFEKLDESKTDEACKMYEAMMIDRMIEAEQVDKKLSP